MHSSSVALVPVAVGVLVGAGNRPLVGGGGDADAGSHAPRLKAAPARRGIQMNPSWHSQLPSSGWHCPRPAPQRTSLLQVPQPSPDHPWTQLQSVPPTSVDTAMFWCITSSARLAVRHARGLRHRHCRHEFVSDRASVPGVGGESQSLYGKYYYLVANNHIVRS